MDPSHRVRESKRDGVKNASHRPFSYKKQGAAQIVFRSPFETINMESADPFGLLPRFRQQTALFDQHRSSVFQALFLSQHPLFVVRK